MTNYEFIDRLICSTEEKMQSANNSGSETMDLYTVRALVNALKMLNNENRNAEYSISWDGKYHSTFSTR